ncbi:MAG: hypothetical protein KDJ19_14765 [Hyphomicrobiaceae bacterium]|nr:hypothetical protein [Hyphomicrobiaceae bacterium]MCC0025078.1 hypothetical protein [Hyphomicrobiaceae bacterium]
MRFVLRFVGTWLLGLALVLMVIDGTKSLAASDIVMTSLSQIWLLVHPQSLGAVDAFMAENGAAAIWQLLRETVLSWPAFAIMGGLGLLGAFAGRRPANRLQNLDRF